jgi:hypothetical protein
VTTAVGRESGVADGVGDGVAETFATEGVAETNATRGEAIVVGTGFTLPASKAEAVALGDAPGLLP